MFRNSLDEGEIQAEVSNRGCLKRLIGFIGTGCLLLVFICLFSLLLAPGINEAFLVPLLESMEWEKLPLAQDRALDYAGEEIRPLPLPEDVILTPALEAKAQQRGYENYFGRYPQLQSCIAAADGLRIKRSHLCALMDMEGGWGWDLVAAETFVTATWKASALLEAGYVRSDPLQIQEALLTYFQKSQERVDIFWEYVDYWEPSVGGARILQPDEYEWTRVPALTFRYWTLEMLGYSQSFTVAGVAGFIIDPGAIPPNLLPEFLDGILAVHPLEGGYISGYRFNPPRHPGVDYSGGDGWVRAAHNGEVSWVGWDPDGYGNYVILQSEFEDGTQLCTLYAHGRENFRDVGDDLRAGDVIFHLGSTGNSTGPHLHFEIRVGGSGSHCSGATYLNPVPVLPPQ